MIKTIWKAIFFVTLTVLTVLTALLIVLICTHLTQIRLADVGIIGGADLPTYLFLWRMLLRHPVFYIWFTLLLTVVISLIGWITSKKRG